MCTKNDRCVNGTCTGTPFTCLECERCNGDGCTIKPDFCVIDGKCYSHKELRPEKPCQVRLLFIPRYMHNFKPLRLHAYETRQKRQTLRTQKWIGCAGTAEHSDYTGTAQLDKCGERGNIGSFPTY